MHKLIIEDDEGRTTVVPLVRDELTIGRKEGNTIRLTERNVSRRHARLFKKNGAICIEDFGSYTGVRVNGVRITDPRQVVDGDQVQIGDYKLSISSEAVTEAATPTVTAAQASASEGASIGAATGDEREGAGTEAGALAGAAGHPVQMDAAPTIPLRTLEEQGRAPRTAAQAGRLVAVTTDLAGQEFRLDRPSLVIGRTEENDIILNHASISRHHAKVIRDGDRYTVVDLQSANGVRVAGESYERVDVQPGDVIELGHVKLRFVGPWEEWSFDPREFAPRSRRKMKIGAGVGGVVLAIVLVSALQGKKPPPPPLPPPVPVAAPIPAGPSPAVLLADAVKAADEQNWDKSITSLDLLLALPPGDPATAASKAQAAELRHKVDIERRNAETFSSFEQAVAAQEPDVALTRFEEIPIDSVYKKRAEPAMEEVKSLFLAAHLDLADSARTQGHCDDARAEVEKVQQLDPENKQAADILKKCRPRPPVAVAAAAPAAAATTTSPAAVPAPHPAAPRPAAAPHPPAPRPVRAAAPTAPARGAAPGAPVRTAASAAPARAAAPAAPARAAIATNTTSERAAAPAGAEDAAPDSADLIKQAREAWMHQQCGSAIDLSRRALKLKPNANDAHQIIAVCACSMKDKDGAARSYSKLDERSRAMVRTLCARNGVELTE